MNQIDELNRQAATAQELYDARFYLHLWLLSLQRMLPTDGTDDNASYPYMRLNGRWQAIVDDNSRNCIKQKTEKFQTEYNISVAPGWYIQYVEKYLGLDWVMERRPGGGDPVDKFQHQPVTARGIQPVAQTPAETAVGETPAPAPPPQTDTAASSATAKAFVDFFLWQHGFPIAVVSI